jgi:PAS domain S-box-containing protein
LIPDNHNASDYPESSDDSKSKSELLDEIQQLRKRLTENEADAGFTKERDQTLSSAINIGYWEWDETTKRAAYFSDEMAGIFGMTLERLYEVYQSEEDFYPFVHPDDIDHYIANLSTVLDPDHPRGLAHAFDYRIVRHNGEVRYVRELEYGIQEENGVVLRTFGAIQDITDRHESTRALMESQRPWHLHHWASFSDPKLGSNRASFTAIKYC